MESDFPAGNPDVTFLDRWKYELREIDQGKSLSDSWINSGGFILSSKGFDIIDRSSPLAMTDEERVLDYIKIFNTYADYPTVIDITTKLFKGNEKKTFKMLSALLEQSKIRFVES